MIAIIGGGPGGLTLARILQVHGIDSVVYERDSSGAARSQGSMLDLHTGTGQAALRAAGLEEEFFAAARREGQDLRMLDHTGALLLQEDTPDDAPMLRPEIDRSDLRDLLLRSLAPQTVRWGSAFTHAEVLPEGYRMYFADGSTATCDLLVGADGANSRVRPLLTDAEPSYAGRALIQSVIHDADRTWPELAAMVGRGNYWVFGPDRMLGAQRNGNGTIWVSISLDGPADADPAAVTDLPAEWAPQFRQLLAACDEPFVVRPVFTLPIGLRWPRRSRATLLGDAAHLMASHGEGANQAMFDAAELGSAIAKHSGDLDAALEQYESGMYVRTTEVAQRSVEVAEMMSGPDAAQKVLRFFGAVD